MSTQGEEYSGVKEAHVTALEFREGRGGVLALRCWQINVLEVSLCDVGPNTGIELLWELC